MSDSTESTATAAPAVEPVVSKPAPAAPSTEAKTLPKVGEPDWLNARIDRAKESGKKEARKSLKEDRKAVKAAAAEAKAVSDKASEEVAAAKMAVEAILADVPETEREALLKAGGGSPAETLKAFSVWKIAKAKAEPKQEPKVEPVAVAAKEPLAAPVTTTASAAAPAAPAGPSTPEDFAATYRDLKASNPYLAAQFLVNAAEQVFPALALKK